MSAQSVRSFFPGTTALAAAVLLASCAVGPDFLHPAAPDVSGYTKEPLAPRTSSTDAPTGRSQRFVQGRDIAQEWWRMFKSPALNAPIALGFIRREYNQTGNELTLRTAAGESRAIIVDLPFTSVGGSTG